MATTTKPSKPTTTLDFVKVFASNASMQPFTWLDSEYLAGWEAIKQTPPARQQFDALQSHSDKKENWLYNQYLEGYVDKYLDYLNTVKAPINSPTFTGDPKAPTPGWNDNDKSLATTEFVQHWIEELRSAIEDIDTGGGGGSSGIYCHSEKPWYITIDDTFVIQHNRGVTNSSGVAEVPLQIQVATQVDPGGKLDGVGAVVPLCMPTIYSGNSTYSYSVMYTSTYTTPNKVTMILRDSSGGLAPANVEIGLVSWGLLA